MGCGASVEASMPNKETLSSTSQVPQEESVAQQQEKEANNVETAATAQAPPAVEVRPPEDASGDQAAQAAAGDDEDDDVPLYDPRFRRLSRADCDSHRESLLHDLAERHARRPSIQFALDENEVTEIPYDESAQKQEDNNNEEDDEDDDDDEESSGSEGAPEELPTPTGKRSSRGDSSRRRSSLEMCSIESKAEHDLREREIAHRRSLQKAAEDGEAHVGFAVKELSKRFFLRMATPSSSAPPSPKKTSRGWNPLPDGGLLASAVTLCKATLGAGSLALPGSIMSTGIPISILLLIVLGILSMISINMIVRAQTHSRMDTFEELVRSYFNNLTGYLFEVAMVIFCFGTAVAYLITVADLLIPVFAKAFGPDAADEAYAYPFLNRPILTVIIAVVLLPLCLVNRINNIRWVSMAGVLSIFILAICVFYFSSSVVYQSILPPLRYGFPSTALALSLIYSELNPRNESTMRIVSVLSVGLCFVTYLTIGVFGFLTYGPATEGSIVKNMTQDFNDGDVFVAVAFILMALAVLAAYPLNIFPIRASIKATIRGITGKRGPFQWWVGPLIVIISIILSVVVAIYLPDVQTVLYFVGSVTGSYIVYVVPGCFCVRLLKARFYADQARQASMSTIEEPSVTEQTVPRNEEVDGKVSDAAIRSKFDYSAVVSWGMVALGLIFFVVGSYQSFVDVIDFYSSQ
ncbi:Solute carrier 38 member [Perkinsus olseni]|uniref:Solute carrier 38 member n=1 Tax=Perkinsus olseni TaxID=32597 RepID=A0A7J6L2V1_PEROL|nr:Solute carrier 38 member [Perkinsus olseni]